MRLKVVDDKFFTRHGIYFIGNSHHINKLWILEKPLLKPKRAILTKWHRSPWSKTHDNIILSKPIVQAHGTTSHFQLMIQAYESYWGNFGSRGLEDQEVCSVKIQWFKVDKGKHIARHVFPNSLNFDGLVCNR